MEREGVGGGDRSRGGEGDHEKACAKVSEREERGEDKRAWSGKAIGTKKLSSMYFRVYLFFKWRRHAVRCAATTPTNTNINHRHQPLPPAPPPPRSPSAYPTPRSSLPPPLHPRPIPYPPPFLLHSPHPDPDPLPPEKTRRACWNPRWISTARASKRRPRGWVPMRYEYVQHQFTPGAGHTDHLMI